MGSRGVAGALPMSEPAAVTVIVRGDDLDIERIQAAIRARIARRASSLGEPAAADTEVERAQLMAHLDDWNFVPDVWHGMWPPNHQPWNLDEGFPIRSHRSGVGALLVRLKRLQRAIIGFLARPLLVRQAEAVAFFK